MGYWLLIPLLIFTALVQGTVVWSLSPVAVVPDLMVLVVVGWGMIRGLRPALFLAIGGGWLLDSLGSAPFGAATLGLMVIAFFSLAGERRLLESPLLQAMGAVFLATFVYNGLLLLILQVKGAAVVGSVDVVGVLLFTAIINTILTPLMYVLLMGVDRGVRALEGKAGPGL